MKPAELFHVALGTTFEKHLHAPALIIGRDIWTREDLGPKVGVINAVAASKLSKIAADLKVRDLKDFIDKTSPYTFTAPQYAAGLTTLYVFFKVCRSKGYIKQLDEWYSLGEDRAVTGFVHFKRQTQQENARTMSHPRAKADKRLKQGNFAPSPKPHTRTPSHEPSVAEAP